MKIGIVGSGYVGLVSAACFAEKGNDVTLMDVDESKIKVLKDGKVPFHEPGLEELVKAASQRGHLSFTADISGVVSSDIIFIAVGTPGGEGGAINTKHIIDAADSIGRAIKDSGGFKAIAVKSTVPPGTTRSLREIISKHTSPIAFDVAANPEFLKEGSAVDDFRKPDRIIVGTENTKVEWLFRELYAPFMRTKDRLLCMSLESAEFTKLAANAMLATRIALMNEFAKLAGDMGADIDDIRRGLGSDPRIGPMFLFPSPGYGGSCFPKDGSGLVEYARITGVPLSILDAVNKSNRIQWYWLADRALKYFGGNVIGKTFAIWGAAFKPRTDDVRHSPAIYTSRRLLDHHANINVYDPERRALVNLERELGNDRVKYFGNYFGNVYDVLENADALLIATDWDEFKGIDIKRVTERLKGRVIIDARNLYSLEKMDELEIDYISLGRPAVLRKS